MEKCPWCGHPDREQHGLQTCAHRIREERDALLLELSEAKKLLVKAEDQGLFHTCGAEGYIEKYGCDECKEGLEGQILKFLGPTIEKLPTEKRNRDSTMIPLLVKCPKCGAEIYDCVSCKCERD